MQEQTLLKISLIISLVGILILMVIATTEPSLSDIKDIENKTAGKVKIQGELVGIKEASKNFYILAIQDKTGTIEVLTNQEILSNSQLEITGSLSVYKDRIQIKADKIKEIKN